jgi:hypothetical protein
VSESARKINLGNKEMPELNKSEVSGYRFINLEILGTIFKLLPCKECHECQFMLIEDDSQCMGCASCLSVWCSSYGCSEVFYTSEKLDHCFEINRRMTYAKRLIGSPLWVISNGEVLFCHEHAHGQLTLKLLTTMQSYITCCKRCCRRNYE